MFIGRPGDMERRERKNMRGRGLFIWWQRAADNERRPGKDLAVGGGGEDCSDDRTEGWSLVILRLRASSRQAAQEKQTRFVDWCETWIGFTLQASSLWREF